MLLRSLDDVLTQLDRENKTLQIGIESRELEMRRVRDVAKKARAEGRSAEQVIQEAQQAISEARKRLKAATGSNRSKST